VSKDGRRLLVVVRGGAQWTLEVGLCSAPPVAPGRWTVEVAAVQIDLPLSPLLRLYLLGALGFTQIPILIETLLRFLLGQIM
jgi:hypothetical protein